MHVQGEALFESTLRQLDLVFLYALLKVNQRYYLFGEFFPRFVNQLIIDFLKQLYHFLGSLVHLTHVLGLFYLLHGYRNKLVKLIKPLFCVNEQLPIDEKLQHIPVVINYWKLVEIIFECLLLLDCLLNVFLHLRLAHLLSLGEQVAHVQVHLMA